MSPILPNQNPMAARRGAFKLLGLALAAGLAVPAYGSIPEAAPPGPPLWDRSYEGSGGSTDGAYALVVSLDGSRVFVTGRSYGADGTFDYTTAAYSTVSGSEQWSARYGGPGGGHDSANALAASPDGSTVYVTGGSDGVDGNPDVATLAYSASSGAVLWVARFEGQVGWAKSVAVSPDGSTVYVTGGSDGVGTYLDYLTAAYSAATGALLWTARYDGTSSGSDEAYRVAVSGDGSRIFVTGNSAAGTTWDEADAATVAYSAASGMQLWTARYDGPAGASDFTNSLAVSPNGSTVIVAGQSEGAGSSFDYATIAYSASTGAELWASRYDGGNVDIANSLAVSPDGSKIFVTGQSYASTYDYATLAYSVSDGALRWTARYNGPANSGDLATSVAVNPDGSAVFVTGMSFGGSGGDYATVAYATASGTSIWTARYDGPASGTDWAHALAVSPDGSKLFVTGEVRGAGGTLDYGTVAYRATSCANGSDEVGPVSGLVHGAEPSSGNTGQYVHGVNCDVVAGSGL